MERKLNVLIACEESQACCRAFRKLGHNAYSCDLFECSGTIFGTDIAEPHPEWHFNHDITTVLNKTDLTLQNGEQAVIDGDWDIMIGHPPCTFLAVSGIPMTKIFHLNKEDHIQDIQIERKTVKMVLTSFCFLQVQISRE